MTKLLKAGGNIRWGILSLLFCCTVLNYIDRQVISILKPTIGEDIGWSEMDYANIIFYFQVAYAIGYVSLGRFIDLAGTKKGLFACVLVWSLACAGHGLARTVMGFGIARFFLGFGESGNYTGCIKATRAWFPAKERALAIGIYNGATNIGAMTAPFLVPWLTIMWGWQSAFYVTGAVGVIWVAAWWIFYHEVNDHPTVSEQEKAYIHQDPPDNVASEKISYLRLLSKRTTWAYAICNLLSAPIFWLYLFWLPDFLFKTHGVKLMDLGLPLFAIYMSASIGSILGGWISSQFIARGMDVKKARKLTMLITLIFISPIAFAPQIESLWGCTAIICVAIGAHQAWTANIWSLVPDSTPGHAVGGVFGFGGMVGALGGMVVAKVVGTVLTVTGSYYVIFLGVPFVYLCGLLALQILLPKKMEQF
ncbi:MFS transporter [Telmatospirillum sp.]|uniref:MFS transporter n=1 Tax=Telmatospirillum sp. TaxID=2079197 RepID=UPI00284D43AC|nr:MFS transporter [Telmatospirillum sp.]MDR3439324.1 MFS transporter [Telmatospirillum sp.]